MLRKLLALLLFLGATSPAFATVLVPQPTTVSATSTPTTVNFNPAANRVDIVNAGSGTAYVLGGIAVGPCATLSLTYSDTVSSTSVYTIGSDTATVYVTGYKLAGAQPDNVIRGGSGAGCGGTLSTTSASFGAATFLSTMSGASATSNFFNLTGTIPTTNTASANAANFQITSAGSSSQVQRGLNIDFLAGYTGSSDTEGLRVSNQSLGTSTGSTTAQTGILGAVFGGAGTTGDRVGVNGYASNGGAGREIGVWGQSDGSAAAVTASVGVVGYGRTGSSTGFVAGLFGATPSSGSSFITGLSSGAVVGDNVAAAIPIFIAFDGVSSTKVWSIEDNGAEWGASAKTLTESSATAFAIVTVTSGTTTAGEVKYSIEANDATDYQSRSGTLEYRCANKAGTTTCQLSRPGGSTTVDNTTDAAVATSGTLTNTFTYTDGGTGAVSLKANAVSSLTQTLLRINYHLIQYGNAAVAFAPQ